MSPSHQNHYRLCGRYFNIMYMPNIFTKAKPFVYPLVVYVVAACFFMAIDPYAGGSLGLIIGFLLLLVVVYVTLRAVGTAVHFLTGSKALLRKRVVILTTGVVGLLLGLRSSGQLSLRDTIVVFLFATLLYGYLNYFFKPRD